MIRLATFLVLWAVSGSAWALDFDRYHSQEEINSYMRQMAAENPDVATFHVLGESEQGREISYLVVTKGDAASLPTMYLNGTHHGNEKSSTEGILGLIDYFITNKDEAAVSALLESYAVYLQPLVNPDGHAANTRGDSRGRDPNRDYAYPGRDARDSFRVKAIGLVRELVDRIQPRAAAAYHSGMTGVLWAWCHTSSRTPDNDVLHTLAMRTALAMDMSLYKQSYFDYPTNGEFIDYAYMKYGTLALTFELSNAGNPPPSQLPAVVRRSVTGAMTFLFNVMDLDQGLLEVVPAPAVPPVLLSRNSNVSTGRVE